MQKTASETAKKDQVFVIANDQPSTLAIGLPMSPRDASKEIGTATRRRGVVSAIWRGDRGGRNPLGRWWQINWVIAPKRPAGNPLCDAPLE